MRQQSLLFAGRLSCSILFCKFLAV